MFEDDDVTLFHKAFPDEQIEFACPSCISALGLLIAINECQLTHFSFPLRFSLPVAIESEKAEPIVVPSAPAVNSTASG